MAGERYSWRGDGPEPPCWQDPEDKTITYRSYSDYVFDDDEPVMNKPRSPIAVEGGDE